MPLGKTRVYFFFFFKLSILSQVIDISSLVLQSLASISKDPIQSVGDYSKKTEIVVFKMMFHHLFLMKTLPQHCFDHSISVFILMFLL